MWRLRLKFGIGFLLFLPLWAAGYLTGSRYGNRELQLARAELDIAIVTRTYDVSDIISPNASVNTNTSLKNLCSLITATIDGKWEFRDDVSLDYSNTDKTLVVTQSGACHAKIEELLGDLRTLVRNRK